jgi:hypothetical protein
LAEVERVISGRDVGKLAHFAEQMQALSGRASQVWCMDALAPGFATGLVERRVELVLA